MGQTVSKAMSRIATTASSSKSTPHIPNMPGKGGGSLSTADPLTGFSRGRRSPGTIGLHQEEAQRQFLQSLQPARSKTSGGGDEQQPTSAPYQDKLPDDLIKFMTDVGPLKSPHDVAAAAKSKGITKRSPRMPRITSASASSSFFAPALNHVDNDDAITSSSGGGGGGANEVNNNNNDLGLPSSSTAFLDKTRKTERMRLAQNIAGYETMRTTSFSHKSDTDDDNANNSGGGLDVVQMYNLLTAQNTTTTTTTTTTELTNPPLVDDQQQQQYQQLLEQCRRYIQVPVLLRDSDGSLVGAHPNHATLLPQIHPGMELVPKSRIKLVLQDLWEIEQQQQREKSSSKPVLPVVESQPTDSDNMEQR